MLNNLNKEQKKALMSQTMAMLKFCEKQDYSQDYSSSCSDEDDCKSKIFMTDLNPMLGILLSLQKNEDSESIVILEKYFEYVEKCLDEFFDKLDREEALEKAWSEFAGALDSGNKSVKKIAYLEIFTFIAIMERFIPEDAEKNENKELFLEVLEEYCEFLRGKLGISPDIARRLEDITNYKIDVCEDINYTVELD